MKKVTICQFCPASLIGYDYFLSPLLGVVTVVVVTVVVVTVVVVVVVVVVVIPLDSLGMPMTKYGKIFNIL